MSSSTVSVMLRALLRHHAGDITNSFTCQKKKVTFLVLDAFSQQILTFTELLARKYASTLVSTGS